MINIEMEEDISQGVIVSRSDAHGPGEQVSAGSQLVDNGGGSYDHPTKVFDQVPFNTKTNNLTVLKIITNSLLFFQDFYL